MAPKLRRARRTSGLLDTGNQLVARYQGQRVNLYMYVAGWMMVL